MSKNEIELAFPSRVGQGNTYWGTVTVHIGTKEGIKMNNKGLRVNLIGEKVEWYMETVSWVDDWGMVHYREERHSRISRVFKLKETFHEYDPLVLQGKYVYVFDFSIPEDIHRSYRSHDLEYNYFIRAKMGRKGMTKFQIDAGHDVQIAKRDGLSEGQDYGDFGRGDKPPRGPPPCHQCATMKIDVLGGRNFPKVDTFGKCDPYVSLILIGNDGLNLQHQNMKTSIKKKTLNPTWNESFTVGGLLVNKDELANFQKLKVQAWDWDKIGSHDFLGEAILTLNQEIPYDDAYQGWVKLTNPKKSKARGDINIRVMYTKAVLNKSSRPNKSFREDRSNKSFREEKKMEKISKKMEKSSKKKSKKKKKEIP